MNALDEDITNLIKIKEDNAKELSLETTALYHSSRTFMIALVLGSVAIGVVLGILISRLISVPLRKSVDLAMAVASGDLTGRTIVVDRKDETGQLAEALTTMVDKLKGIVGDVQTASDNVASGSQQLSSGSEQLSQGTTEQAANAEEASVVGRGNELHHQAERRQCPADREDRAQVRRRCARKAARP